MTEQPTEQPTEQRAPLTTVVTVIDTANGRERRDVYNSDLNWVLHDKGALELVNADGDSVALYASGAWVGVRWVPGEAAPAIQPPRYTNLPGNPILNLGEPLRDAYWDEQGKQHQRMDG